MVPVSYELTDRHHHRYRIWNAGATGTENCECEYGKGGCSESESRIGEGDWMGGTELLEGAKIWEGKLIPEERMDSDSPGF